MSSRTMFGVHLPVTALGILMALTATAASGQIVDSNFRPVVLGVVTAIMPASNGTVLVGGRFSSINGSGPATLVRLRADGTNDNTFTRAPAATHFASVRAIALQADGKVVGAGEPNPASARSLRRTIARFNADGTLDGSFRDAYAEAGVAAVITAVAVQPDGRLLVAGAFRIGRSAFLAIQRATSSSWTRPVSRSRHSAHRSGPLTMPDSPISGHSAVKRARVPSVSMIWGRWWDYPAPALFFGMKSAVCAISVSFQEYRTGSTTPGRWLGTGPMLVHTRSHGPLLRHRVVGGNE